MWLAGFSLWASIETRAAARQVGRHGAEQQVWQTARLELAGHRRRPDDTWLNGRPASAAAPAWA
jgi:hypothetical protein